MGKKRKDKFWRGTGKFILVMVSIYLVVWAVIKLTDYAKNQTVEFGKQDIEIEGNKLVSSQKIISLCGFRPGTEERIEIDIQKLAKEISALTFVRGVSITKRLPRILNITIEERQPLAFIYGRGLNLIDRDGVLLPIPEKEIGWDLPLISGIREPLGQLGKRTQSGQALTALSVAGLVEDFYPLLNGMISEINCADKDFMRFYLVKGGAEVRVRKDSFEKEIYVLQNYLLNYIDWATVYDIDYIDLRFKNQLIVKERDRAGRG